jgi:hypothetical protein
METHVVTVEIGFRDGRMPVHIITELFRGSEQECISLCGRIPGASHDQRSIGITCLQVGPIAEWEEFTTCGFERV